MQRAGDVPGHRHHHHDDAAAAEVTMMERETLGYGIGRPHVSRRLLDQTADAIGPLPGRELLVEPGRRSGLAVGIAQERGSEEHTSELQSLMRISYAVFCLKKKKY